MSTSTAIHMPPDSKTIDFVPQLTARVTPPLASGESSVLMGDVSRSCDDLVRDRDRALSREGVSDSTDCCMGRLVASCEDVTKIILGEVASELLGTESDIHADLRFSKTRWEKT